MTRISSEGKQEDFALALGETIEKLGITLLASRPGGTIYAAATGCRCGSFGSTRIAAINGCF
jgi:hypothetical protein